MKITNKWLKKRGAYPEGIIDWVAKQDTSDAVALIARLMTHNIKWANWLIARCLNRPNRIRYSVYSWKQVAPLWSSKYPDDTRPQKAIKAVKAVLENDTPENRGRARQVADDAIRAIFTSHVDGATSANVASKVASNVVHAAIYLATPASAYYATSAVENVASIADGKTLEKIIKYGIGLLKEQGVRK